MPPENARLGPSPGRPITKVHLFPLGADMLAPPSQSLPPIPTGWPKEACPSRAESPRQHRVASQIGAGVRAEGGRLLAGKEGAVLRAALETQMHRGVSAAGSSA